MAQGGQQGDQSAGVFELPIDSGAVSDFSQATTNLFACAYDQSDPSATLAIYRGDAVKSAGLDLGDKYLDGAAALAPTLSDCGSVKQPVADVKGDSMSVPNVFAQVAKDAVRGQSGMNALKNQAFDDLVKAA